MHSLVLSVRASACAYALHAACDDWIDPDRGLTGGYLRADVAGEVIGEGEIEQCLDGRAEQPCTLQGRDRTDAIHQAQPQLSEPRPGRRVTRPALGGARRRVGREVECAHVLVDPGGEPLRRRPVGLDPGPVTNGAAGGRQVAGLPEGHGQQAQHRRVGRLGITRIHQASGRQARRCPRPARAGRRS